MPKDNRIRLDFILSRLVGAPCRINRADLIEHFGVSTVTASHDLKQAAERWPGLMTYDRSAKVYQLAGIPNCVTPGDLDAAKMLRKLAPWLKKRYGQD